MVTARAETRFNCSNMADDSENRTPEPSDLAKIAEVLQRYQVEFLVIGGQAEILMGSPRVTFDTDLCYRRSQQNLERLADAIAELRPALRGAARRSAGLALHA